MSKAVLTVMAMFTMRQPRPPRLLSRPSIGCFSMIRKSTSVVGYHITRQVREFRNQGSSSPLCRVQERQSKLDAIRSQFTNLYVKNIDPDVSQDELIEVFKRYGKVTSAVIQIDEEGRRKGFGFVNFESHEQAQAAVDGLHDTDLKGMKLFVSRAQKKAERMRELRKKYQASMQEKVNKYQGLNLYINNLEDDIDDEKLRAEFEHFGTITSCKVMCDEKGTSKGYGFVCFSSPDEATKAIVEMNNKIIGTQPLYVSLSRRRKVRRQLLESQIAQRNQQLVSQLLREASFGGAPSMSLPIPGITIPVPRSHS